MSKICPSCHTEYDDNFKFCGECGTHLEEKPKETLKSAEPGVPETVHVILRGEGIIFDVQNAEDDSSDDYPEIIELYGITGDYEVMLDEDYITEDIDQKHTAYTRERLGGADAPDKIIFTNQMSYDFEFEFDIPLKGKPFDPSKLQVIVAHDLNAFRDGYTVANVMLYDGEEVVGDGDCPDDFGDAFFTPTLEWDEDDRWYCRPGSHASDDEEEEEDDEQWEEPDEDEGVWEDEEEVEEEEDVVDISDKEAEASPEGPTVSLGTLNFTVDGNKSVSVVCDIDICNFVPDENNVIDPQEIDFTVTLTRKGRGKDGDLTLTHTFKPTPDGTITAHEEFMFRHTLGQLRPDPSTNNTYLVEAVATYKENFLSNPKEIARSSGELNFYYEYKIFGEKKFVIE